MMILTGDNCLYALCESYIIHENTLNKMFLSIMFLHVWLLFCFLIVFFHDINVAQLIGVAHKIEGIVYITILYGIIAQL